jgi:hypothetical protein
MTRKPCSRSHRSAAGRAMATTGVLSAAPMLAFCTSGWVSANPCSTTSTAEAPAPSAQRISVPRLPGRSQPSATTTRVRGPTPMSPSARRRIWPTAAMPSGPSRSTNRARTRSLTWYRSAAWAASAGASAPRTSSGQTKAARSRTPAASARWIIQVPSSATASGRPRRLMVRNSWTLGCLRPAGIRTRRCDSAIECLLAHRAGGLSARRNSPHGTGKQARAVSPAASSDAFRKRRPPSIGGRAFVTGTTEA